MEKNHVLNHSLTHSLSLFDAPGTELLALRNNNNNVMYKVPVCRGTSVALADSSSCVD